MEASLARSAEREPWRRSDRSSSSLRLRLRCRERLPLAWPSSLACVHGTEVDEQATQVTLQHAEGIRKVAIGKGAWRH